MKNHGTCPRAKRHQRDCAKVAWRAEKQKLKLERRKAKRKMANSMFDDCLGFEEILDNFMLNNEAVDKEMLRSLYFELKNSKEESQERYINEMHGAN